MRTTKLPADLAEPEYCTVFFRSNGEALAANGMSPRQCRNSIFVARLSTHAKRTAVDHSKFTITELLLFIVHLGTTNMKMKYKCMRYERERKTQTQNIQIFLVLYFCCLSGISVVFKYGSASASVYEASLCGAGTHKQKLNLRCQLLIVCHMLGSRHR